MSSYFVRLRLPKGMGAETREALSDILVRVASRFSFQGLEDWSVDLRAGEKVLGAEREFHDLRGKGKESAEIRVYFARKTDGADFGRLVRASFAELKVASPEKLAPRDWMREWRKHYKVQTVRAAGLSLRIVPAWKKAPAGLSVKIHPGQAFGTGTHPTTRLCLAEFLRATEDLPARVRLLDFGAGTGVLALAALAWARREKRDLAALAVESDPEGMKACRKNAGLNRLRLAVGRKLPGGRRFDFVFANVLAPVLLEHREGLVRAVADDGWLVLSGILAKEADDFALRFRHPALRLIRLSREGDWAALLYQRV
jgi:ribosomal protein L11 methyltransferase